MSDSLTTIIHNKVASLRRGLRIKAITFGRTRGTFDGGGGGFDVLCEIAVISEPHGSHDEVCCWSGSITAKEDGRLAANLFAGAYTTDPAEADRIYADKVRRLNL